MSIEMTALVLRAQTNLNAQAKLVLLGLADHADVHGEEAWPSVAVLSHYAECSERTVQRHLGTLRDLGMVVIQREAGYRKPNVYALNVSLLASMQPPKGDKLTPTGRVTTETKGDNPSTTRVTNPASMGVTAVSHEPPLEPNHPEEPSLERAALAKANGHHREAQHRDRVFETLAALEGYDYTAEGPRPNTTEASRIGTAAAKVRAAGVDDPQLLARCISMWPEIFPGATCTASAVATHIGRLRMAAQQGLIARKDEDTVEALAAKLTGRLSR